MLIADIILMTLVTAIVYALGIFIVATIEMNMHAHLPKRFGARIVLRLLLVAMSPIFVVLAIVYFIGALIWDFLSVDEFLDTGELKKWFFS